MDDLPLYFRKPTFLVDFGVFALLWSFALRALVLSLVLVFFRPYDCLVICSEK